MQRPDQKRIPDEERQRCPGDLHDQTSLRFVAHAIHVPNVLVASHAVILAADSK
jgi:hypothetical protein